MTAVLTDIERPDAAIDSIATDDPLLARYIDAATHLTIAANFVRGGNRANTIADRATAVLDIRSLPGMDGGFIVDHLRHMMGAAGGEVEITFVSSDEATISVGDGALWDAIADSVEDVEGHRNIVPVLGTVSTDARFWRRKGTVAYGVGLYDDQTRFSDLLSLFHGSDERVAVQSVLRSTSLYQEILDRF
jgi:acetylornithine deacetylase/succinyl-diaminopimelate desuccinylase-like protein